jgi:hypothetical protein
VKSLLINVSLLLVTAGPALAGEAPPVSEPGGVGAVAGVIAALIALKALRK